MVPTRWHHETRNGLPVAIYEEGVVNADERSIFGRVLTKGRWLPQSWFSSGHVLAAGSPHPFDLVLASRRVTGPDGVTSRAADILEIA
jgi:hypothetical protein